TIYPGRRSIGAVIINHFINYVPGMYTTRITTRYNFNMLPHTLNLLCWRVGFAFFVLKKPCGCLVMPYQGMTDNVHTVLLTKLDEGIRWCEIENPWLRIYYFRLHYVFGCNCIEVL